MNIKAQKGVDKNVAKTISQKEYKEFLLNKKCFRHLMNRIPSKDRKIGSYEINKISISFFNDKIYIQTNVSNRFACFYRSNYLKDIYLKNY